MRRWLLRNLGLTVKQAAPWAIVYGSLFTLLTLLLTDLLGLRWAIISLWGGVPVVVGSVILWTWLQDRRFEREWRRGKIDKR